MILPIPCHHTCMNKTQMNESSFYVRRTWTTFSGTVVKMDHVGPYHEGQEYAVAMQRKHDMDRAVPATEQITKWEWVDGCLLYTSPSPRDRQKSRMPSSA